VAGNPLGGQVVVVVVVVVVGVEHGRMEVSPEN